jgi:hypothetical protein
MLQDASFKTTTKTLNRGIVLLLLCSAGPLGFCCVEYGKERRMRRGDLVACLLLIVFLAFPRIVLVLLFLFSNYLQRAYHGIVLLLLGFLFLPLTTLVYAWMMNTRQPIAGTNLLILIIAVVIDVGGLGSGERHRRSRN